MSKKLKNHLDKEAKLSSTKVITNDYGRHEMSSIYLTKDIWDNHPYFDAFYHYGKDSQYYDHVSLHYTEINQFNEDDKKYFDNTGYNVINMEGLIEKYPNMLYNTNNIFED